MMELLEKTKLIDDLIRENPDHNIRDYLETKADIELVNGEELRRCKLCRKIITNPELLEYCSRKCKDKDQIIYDDQIREYVDANIWTMNIKTLARNINATETGLRKQIGVWRGLGYSIGGNKYSHIKTQK